MPFIPNSKILKKYAKGTEIVYKQTKKTYKGPYILTHDHKLYAGHNNIKLGPELQHATDLDHKTAINKSLNDFGRTRAYNIIKPKIKKFISAIKAPPINKPFPSPTDYANGYFKRYFYKKINNFNYIEISKDDYGHLINKTTVYDYNMYEGGSIVWTLRGDNIHKSNHEELERLSVKFPHLMTLFPILNEYSIQEPSLKIQENLTTNGGELYYINGNEYIGQYHIHPEKGPMVGSTHVEHNHEKLYYTNSLPTYTDSTYEEFLNNYGNLDCFSCRKRPNGIKIHTFKSSKIKGCPKGSFPTQKEAYEDCQGNTLSEGKNTSSGGGGY